MRECTSHRAAGAHEQADAQQPHDEQWVQQVLPEGDARRERHARVARPGQGGPRRDAGRHVEAAGQQEVQQGDQRRRQERVDHDHEAVGDHRVVHEPDDREQHHRVPRLVERGLQEIGARPAGEDARVREVPDLVAQQDGSRPDRGEEHADGQHYERPDEQDAARRPGLIRDAASHRRMVIRGCTTRDGDATNGHSQPMISIL